MCQHEGLRKKPTPQDRPAGLGLWASGGGEQALCTDLLSDGTASVCHARVARVRGMSPTPPLRTRVLSKAP